MKPNDLQDAIRQAAALARYAKDHQAPTAFEVVKTRNGYEVQPAGMHKLFKTHTLMHTEPTPKD